ncbi:recombinase family protein [Mobiluncus curtisii]|uniref:recombinase family protein n=1 Tax=Mobiluncus curtisii TaxID=2051 RepID=UPI0001E09505|nr:recombinase family protein [Mobiluncus curtisii]EFL94026.1 resolvase, N-terminal domain protein [Mobiluncus curtisii subsp. curtisii ATCC 35241]QQT12907.1 recombinase family protein [Mobiluncus curtisii]STY77507.1 Transposon Tn3 resolvase [Mobiluncus curtisii subsp. curtisii]
MVMMERVTPPPQRAGTRKVAAYARISMETDRTPKSLSAQISHYSELIQSTPGWEYAGVFADSGISGTTTNRPQFQSMLDCARTGEIDLILTKSISRFARNTVDLLETIRELKTLGVEVRFEKENISTFSADGELVLTLLASFAQAESEQISQNVKWRVRKGFEQGKANGFHLYGYTDSADATDVEIVEAEAEVVRLVYRNYLANISCEQTAAQLEADGVRSRAGEPIRPETLRSWLRMETYTGTLTLGRWVKGRLGEHSKPNTGEADMYRVENAIPAIIDHETFQAVQEERTRRRSLGARANKAIPTTTFTHMVYCLACEKYYRSSVNVAYDGSRRRKWVCATNREKGHGCASKRIPQPSLEQVVCEALNLEAFNEDVFAKLVQRIDVPDSDTAIVVLKNGTTSTHTLHYPSYRKDHWNTPGYRERHSQKLRAYWANLTDEERATISKQRSKTRQAEPAEKKTSRSNRAKAAWTPERRARQSEIAKRVNAQLGEEGRRERSRKAQQAIAADPSVAERKRRKMLDHWANPDYRASTTEAMKGSRRTTKVGE